MNRWLAFLLTLIAPLHLLAATSESEAFDTANRFFEEGKYDKAIQAYEDLHQTLTNGTSVALLFNLGNAYFKAGQLGKAIAQYRHAEALAPHDPDVEANLQFARGKVAGPSYSPNWAERQMERLTAPQWSLLASAVVWLFFGLLIAGQLKPAWRDRLGTYKLVAGVAALLLGGILAWHIKNIANTRVAVVTSPEAVLRLGPLEESKAAFTVRNGAELRVLDKKDNWLRATPGGGQSGWVNKDAVQLVP